MGVDCPGAKNVTSQWGLDCLYQNIGSRQSGTNGGGEFHSIVRPLEAKSQTFITARIKPLIKALQKSSVSKGRNV